MKNRILLSLLFASFLTFSQVDKPIVIHEFVQEDAVENIVGSGNKFKADKVLGASCWNDLDPDYININNTMYGNESYSSSNPLDDGSYGPIELGWTFTFYGVEYTTLYINANGNVTFGNLYSAYSAIGFPSSNVPAMISPFWADADLRGTGTGANQIYVKLESNKITIQWVGVGYYNQKTNLTNTFQVVLTDGSDPEIGIGYNTRFAYGDMNWCVGDASGGTNGFGSNVYATVGAQSAGGSNYYQIGLFSNDNSSYDGAGGSLDGVHYLDGRCFTMDLRNTNVPPVANDLPESREISLCPNMTYSLSSSFSAPEVSQTTSTTVTNSTLSNFTFTSQNGNLSLQTINISTTAQDVGTHYIYYQSTDNGTPTGITYDTVKVNVYECSSSGYPSSFYLDGVDDYAVVQNHNALYSGGSGTYSFWVFPESTSQVGEIPILSKADQFFLGINGVTNVPVFRVYVSGVWYTLTG